MTCRNTHPDEWLTELKQTACRLHLDIIEGDIYPGDLYLANRNLGPILLTCKCVVEDLDLSGNITTRTVIADDDHEFKYNAQDCVRVIENGCRHG